jgi:hypothetical protein
MAAAHNLAATPIGACRRAFEVIAEAHPVDRVVADTAKTGLVSEGERRITAFRAQGVPNPSGWR